jgi:hypothetical protein
VFRRAFADLWSRWVSDKLKMSRVAASVFYDSSIRGRIPMPIGASLRWFYPIDGPQLSREVRFGHARGRCETYSRRQWHQVER